MELQYPEYEGVSEGNLSLKGKDPEVMKKTSRLILREVYKIKKSSMDSHLLR